MKKYKKTIILLGIQKELSSTKKLVENFDLKLKEKDREIYLLKESNTDIQSKFDKFFFKNLY